MSDSRDLIPYHAQILLVPFPIQRGAVFYYTASIIDSPPLHYRLRSWEQQLRTTDRGFVLEGEGFFLSLSFPLLVAHTALSPVGILYCLGWIHTALAMLQ